MTLCTRSLLFLTLVDVFLIAQQAEVSAQGASRAYISTEVNIGFPNNTDGRLRPIDTRRKELEAPIGRNIRNPRAIAASPDGETLYIADNRIGTLHIFDAISSQRLKRIPLRDFSNSTGGMAASPDGKFLYAATGARSFAKSLLVFDAEQNTLETSINLARFGDSVNGVAVSPDSSRVFVAIGSNPNTTTTGSVLVVDTNGHRVLSRVLVSGGTVFDLAVTPDGSTVWATNEKQDQLVLIDVATRRIIRRIDLPDGTAPQNIVITPDGAKAYVTTLSDQLLVVDVASEQVVNSVAIPDQLSLASTPNGEEIYVLSQPRFLRRGSVFVVDTEDDTVAATIATPFVLQSFGVTVGVFPDGPTLDAVEPATGFSSGGFEVELQGDEFTADVQVFFGIEEAEIREVVSSESIIVIAPPNPLGPVDVQVRNGLGQVSLLRAGFEYVLPDTPDIAQIDPAQGDINGGEEVTITGGPFAQNTTVLFGDAPATVTAVSPDRITVVSPPQTDVGQVVVTIRDPFEQQATGAFDYIRVGFPAISAFDPSVIPTAGDVEVTIEGEFFSPGAVLSVEQDGESVDVEVIFDSANQLRFFAPSLVAGNRCTAADVTVRVTNPSQDQATGAVAYEPTQVFNVTEGQSIQKALDAAVPGACILVEEGLYVENIVFGQQPVTLLGVGPLTPHQQVLQAADPFLPVVRVSGGPETGTILKGFAVVRGNGGIEVDNSLPRLENLLIQNNLRAGDGGGIAVLNASDPILRQLDIRTNASEGSGGGIFISPGPEGGEPARARFRESVEVVGNTAGELGGGVFLPSGSDVVIPELDASANKARTGGGLFVGIGSVIEIENSTFNENTVEEAGGGIFVVGTQDAEVPATNITISDSNVSENIASGDGGGIHIGTRGVLDLRGSTVASNVTEGRGVGLFLGEDARIEVDASRFEANSGLAFTADGGGMFASRFVVGRVQNSVFLRNAAQQGGAAFLSAKTGVDFLNNLEINENRVTVLPGEQGEEETPVRGPGILSVDSESDFIGNTIRENRASGATETTGGLHLVQPFLVPEIVDNVIEENTTVDLVCSPDGSEVILVGNVIQAEVVGCEDATLDFQ